MLKEQTLRVSGKSSCQQSVTTVIPGWTRKVSGLYIETQSKLSVFNKYEGASRGKRVANKR